MIIQKKNKKTGVYEVFLSLKMSYTECCFEINRSWDERYSSYKAKLTPEEYIDTIHMLSKELTKISRCKYKLFVDSGKGWTEVEK